jgi:hypothetical protein
MNGKPSSNSDWRPEMNGHVIDEVKSYCYLGVIISSNGSFSTAVNSLYSPPLESREPRNLVLSKFCSESESKYILHIIASTPGTLDHL